MDVVVTAPTASQPAPPPDTRELDRSLVRGVAWTGAFKWLSQIVTWLGTIVVARLLTPQDYGLVGMAERVTLLGGTLEAGPGPDHGWTVHAVIPRREART